MYYDLKNVNGQLKPKAVLALENLDNVPLYHSARGLRHPLGIFNFTFGEVISKTTKLLNLLDNATQNLPYLDAKQEGWEQELLDATDHFLDAIMQHLDGFRSIICCFFEDCSSKAAQKVLRSLSRDIKEYRDHVACIINSIKHEQRRLNLIFFHDIGIFVPGYFVEGILPNGAIGPDPKVHSRANAAISYNRDIPFHYCNLYHSASTLAQHIYDVARVKSSENPISDSDQKLEQILKRVAILPMLFFPDEVKKPLPLVRYKPIRTGNNCVHIILEMPAKRFKARTIPLGCRIQTSFSGDGITKSFKMPYFGEGISNDS